MRNINSIAKLGFITLFFIACQQEDIFEITSSLGTEENAKLSELMVQVEAGEKNMISIADLKALHVSGEVTEIVANHVLKGYVVSSDATGNFYKEVFIQDAPSAPTAAIRVLIDVPDSYNMFNPGREVYIDLNGLYLGEIRTGDGLVSLGEFFPSSDRIENMREPVVKAHMLRASNTDELTPMAVKFSEISNAHVGMWVEVSDVNVASRDAGKPYVDPRDSFDTQRTLEACEGFSKSTFTLETSAFAAFKQDLLPEGTGTVRGVVSKTYDGRSLVLMLNTIADVDMSGDPCTLLDLDDFETVLNETFDVVRDNTDFDYPGWVNFAEEGNELWSEQFFNNNGYVEFSGFRTGDDVNIGWLVSPSFDLSTAASAYVSFKLAQHHLDDDVNNTLEAFVSTDFDGSDVLSASWTKLNISVPGEDNTWYAFQDAGLIDVSSYSGTLYLAFKYTGSGTDTSLDGGYFVDDVLFLKQ